MKKEVFEEILKKLNIERGKLFLMKDIDAIILNNGVGIYPNWAHMRFLITPKDEILIQHGISEPYGGRLSSNFQVKIGYKDILFSSPSPVLGSIYCTKTFRNPKAGDILCVIDSYKNRITQQTIISTAETTGNGFYISVVTPLELGRDSLLCFYDPSVYDVNTCVHSTEELGIFLKYFPNSGKRVKNYGVFQQTINIKDIKEILLSLKSTNTYSIS